jgi:hypothetical protein
MISMRSTGSYKNLLLAQGGYTLITAIWGLADIHSFTMVTGPKHDIWLVKTVSVLLVAISVSFIAQAKNSQVNPESVLLGLLVSAGLASIDFYYSLNGTISVVYLADGILEIIFFAAWCSQLVQICRRRGI